MPQNHKRMMGIRVTGDVALDGFKSLVRDLVHGGKYPGLAFGTPASGPQTYGSIQEIPINLCLSLVGMDVSKYIKEFESIFGVEFYQDETYGTGQYRGIKKVANPDTGVEYEFEVEVWDLDHSIFSRAFEYL